MIANEEQFAFVKTQVAHIEAALESLAKTVRPKSEKQFRIIAEGYVDQLAVLRADIDAYLGVWTVKNSGCPLHDPNPPSDKTKTTKRTK